MSLAVILQQSWNGGVHLVLIAILGIIVCILGSTMDFKGSDLLYADISWSASWLFIVHLVATIITSFPISLDIILDGIVRGVRSVNLMKSEPMACLSFESYLPNFIVIISQVVPSVIILSSQSSIKVAISVSFARYALMYFGIFNYLWINEQSTFKRFTFLLSYVLINVSLIAFSLNLSYSLAFQSLFYLFILSGVVGGALFAYHTWLWYLKMSHSFTNHWVTSQLNSSVYILLLAASVVAVFIISLCITKIDDVELGLILLTYPCGVFTLLLTVLQARISRYDARLKEFILDTKRSMVRFVSHEIRTPLNAVTMGLQLLQEQLDEISASDDAFDSLRDVETNCKASLEVLNELLLFEKMEAGITTLEKARVKALRVIKSTVDPFAIQARMKTITLKFPEEGSTEYLLLQSTYLFADANRLTQVLRNLISNALKFTPRGGSVAVSVEAIEDAIVDENGMEGARQKLLRLRVKDSGPGLSEENLSRLFKEIVQFDAGKLQGGGGSGFGLYLSKTIVDLHNGRIFATSEGVGKGCTFILDLPISNDSSDADNRRSSSRSKTNSSGASKLGSLPNFRSSVRQSSRFSSSLSRVAVDSIPESDVEESRTSISSSISTPSVAMQITFADAPSSAPTSSEDVSSSDQPMGSVLNSIPTDEVVEEKVGDRLRVLVVDDADSNRKVLVRLLQRRYSVRQAVDGQIAVSVVKAVMGSPNSFDVILMDNEMPNMNGPTAAQVLRAAGYKGVIIGITGHVHPEDIADYVAHGADRVMMKPVYMTDLETTIAECLNGRRR